MRCILQVLAACFVPTAEPVGLTHKKLGPLCDTHVQACTEDLDQLRHEHSAEQAAHTALREEAGKLRERLLELGDVEGKLTTLQQQHTAAEAKLEALEQEKLVSTAYCSLQDVWCVSPLNCCIDRPCLHAGLGEAIK
jgi:hypothetical protein